MARSRLTEGCLNHRNLICHCIYEQFKCDCVGTLYTGENCEDAVENESSNETAIVGGSMSTVIALIGVAFVAM